MKIKNHNVPINCNYQVEAWVCWKLVASGKLLLIYHNMLFSFVGYLTAALFADLRTWIAAFVCFFVAIFYFAIRNCVMHFNMHVHCLRWPTAVRLSKERVVLCHSTPASSLSVPLYARIRTHRSMWTSSGLSLWCCCNQHTRALAMANWVNGTNVVSVAPFRLTFSAWRHRQTIKFNIQPERENGRGVSPECALHATICWFPLLICRMHFVAP